MKTTSERVITLIAEQLGLEESQVTADKRIVAELGADSLDLVELGMALEDEFGIDEIPYEDLKELAAPADVIAYVERVTA